VFFSFRCGTVVKVLLLLPRLVFEHWRGRSSRGKSVAAADPGQAHPVVRALAVDHPSPRERVEAVLPGTSS